MSSDTTNIKLSDVIRKSVPGPFWWKIAAYSTAAFLEGLRQARVVKTQIKGVENLKKGGPFLVMATHSKNADIYVLQSIWGRMDPVPRIHVVAKSNLLGEPHVDACVRKLLAPVAFFVYRTDRLRGLTAKQKQQMKKANQQQVESIKNAYLQGDHMLIFPEGTTRTNGPIGNFKTGAYYLSRVNGYRVRCLPISITHDMLSAQRLVPGRDLLSFINVGEPYDPGNAEKEVFLKDAREKMIALNTITADQLLAHMMYSNKGEVFSFEETVQYMAECVAKLRQEGFAVDQQLETQVTAQQRVDQLLYNTLKEGYIFGGSNMFALTDRAFTPAFVEREQRLKSNKLGFAYNKITQMAQQEDAIREILE